MKGVSLFSVGDDDFLFVTKEVRYQQQIKNRGKPLRGSSGSIFLVPSSPALCNEHLGSMTIKAFDPTSFDE